MGTGDFSLKALVALYEFGVDLVVYTKPPQPSGRNYKVQKSAVHNFAEEKEIPFFFPRHFRSQDEVEKFRLLKPDLAIVSSYGLIIPQSLLDIPPYGFINIHASILPRWRGAAPIQSALLAGDSETGISIMKMDAGVDTGDIISTKSINISEKITHGELSHQLGNLGAAMIIETLKDLEKCLSNSRKQPEEGVTYAQKITKSDCKIDWNDCAESILRRIRAFAPTPAAWTEIEDLRIKIFDAEIIENGENSTPGLVSDDLVVTCRVGSLKLTDIQPAGKNRMSGKDFLRGHKNFVGKIL
jgi:methionyl-tRNA formyltransferase